MGRYSNLLNKININSNAEDPKVNDRVLLIDCMNMFLRSFAVIPKMNTQGHHIGGLVGFLKSLGAMINLHQPTRVILVFDGEGNTTNKKNIYTGYKGTRKIKRITNWSSFDSLQEESESIENQLLRLIDYLKFLPVNISVIDKLEADDIIAYLAPKSNQSIIISADQDFLQLVSENVTVYSPIKKKYYTPEKVMEEFGLYPQNFLSMKILLGDTSDNVPKVPKLGKVKLFQLFPELSTDNKVTLEYIIDKSYTLATKKGNNPLYGNVYNFRKQLEVNKRIMDLENLNISDSHILRIEETYNTLPPKLQSHKFINLYEQDRLENSIKNVNLWVNSNFEQLNKFK